MHTYTPSLIKWLSSFFRNSSLQLRHLAELLLCFPGGSDGEESACNARDLVRSLGWESLDNSDCAKFFFLSETCLPDVSSYLPFFYPFGIQRKVDSVSHVTVVYLQLIVSAWVFSGPHKPPRSLAICFASLHSPRYNETQSSCFKGRDRYSWLREDLTMKCTFHPGWAPLIFDDKWVDEWVCESAVQTAMCLLH